MNYAQLLKRHYTATLANPNQLILFLEGEKGMGKTQTVKEFCKSENVPLTIMNLSAIEAADFTGIPRVENGQTVYSKPRFLSQEDGVIFLDEMNRISCNDVKSALLSLLVDRSINGHKLSDKVMIVTAGNPNGGSDYDTNEFDAAMKDRLAIVKFVTTKEGFLDYIRGRHERTALRDFYEISINQLTKHSFRRLEYALNYYEVTHDEEAINYLLSSSIYTLFREYCAKNLFTLKDLKAGKIKGQLETSAEKKLLLDIQTFIMSEDLWKISSEESKNINKFLHEAKEENKIGFFNFLDKILMESKEFEKRRLFLGECKMLTGMKERMTVFLRK